MCKEHTCLGNAQDKEEACTKSFATYSGQQDQVLQKSGCSLCDLVPNVHEAAHVGQVGCTLSGKGP